jgi:hypothetical protein
VTSALARRVADLRAVIREHHHVPVGALTTVGIYCDECGRLILVVPDEADVLELISKGWHVATERPYRDLCPSCR